MSGWVGGWVHEQVGGWGAGGRCARVWPCSRADGRAASARPTSSPSSPQAAVRGACGVPPHAVGPRRSGAATLCNHLHCAPLWPCACPAAPAATSCRARGRPQSLARQGRRWSAALVGAQQRAQSGCCSRHGPRPLGLPRAHGGLRQRQPSQPQQQPCQAGEAGARLVEVRAEEDDGGGGAHQAGQPHDHPVEHGLVWVGGWAGRRRRSLAWQALQAAGTGACHALSHGLRYPGCSQALRAPSPAHLRGRDLRKVEGAGGQRAKGRKAQRLAQPQVAPPGGGGRGGDKGLRDRRELGPQAAWSRRQRGRSGGGVLPAAALAGAPQAALLERPSERTHLNGGPW